VGRVLAETDVVVVPSLWYENSPVVIQEAFAAGIPVVASNIGALPEKVGSAGWLFSAGNVDELRELVQHIAAIGIPANGAEGMVAPRSIAEAAERSVRIYTSARIGSSNMS